MVSGPISAESDKMRMDNTAKLNRVADDLWFPDLNELPV
jgi:hypothetical protein